MELTGYIESIRRQFAAAAVAGGDEAKAQAERQFAPLESAIRLALQDALAAAAEEITCDLAPGSVEVRLRGREPEFVVTLPPADLPEEGADLSPADWASGQAALGTSPGAEADEGGMARINLRMPDQLKSRVETAAGTEGLSVNAWLVRAAAGALQRHEPSRPPQTRASLGSKRYTGWAR